jgi:hypothetical protein
MARAIADAGWPQTGTRIDLVRTGVVVSPEQAP